MWHLSQRSHPPQETSQELRGSVSKFLLIIAYLLTTDIITEWNGMDFLCLPFPGEGKDKCLWTGFSGIVHMYVEELSNSRHATCCSQLV